MINLYSNNNDISSPFSRLAKPKKPKVWNYEKYFPRKIIYKNVFLSHVPITYTEIKYAYESKYLNIVVVTFICRIVHMYHINLTLDSIKVKQINVVLIVD